jgi:hypothetical protein
MSLFYKKKKKKKKLKSYMFYFFAVKNVKTHFWEKLENEAFSQKLFIDIKSIFSNTDSDMF